jgi:hypothetical protein
MNSSSENNTIRALRDCVKLFANVLLILKILDNLKMNSSLWTMDCHCRPFCPGFMFKWLSEEKLSDTDPRTASLVCAGLQTNHRVVSIGYRQYWNSS